MMRSILCICLLTTMAVTAQDPTVTRANYFEIGDSALLYVKFDTSVWSIDAGDAGENVIWDFSAVDFHHPSVMVDTLIFVDPAGTPFYPSYMGADYSAANLCMIRRTDEFSPENNDHNYYFLDDDSLAFLGHWAATGGSELWEDQYPDPLRELVFPFTFGDSYVDTFHRTYFDMSGSDEHSISGTRTVIVDGSGSLITPDGELLDDVLRVHEVTEFTDSSIFGQQSYTSAWYRWYSASEKGYVIALDMNVDDPGMVNTAYYQQHSNLITHLPQELAGPDAMQVFPLPATDGVMITWSGEMTSVTLHDLMGRVVVRRPLRSGNNWMERGAWEAGTYILNVHMSDGSLVVARVIFE